MSDIHPGDVVRLSASFAVDAAPTDPDSVTLRYRPHGEIEVSRTYTFGAVPPDPSNVIVRDGVGAYHADIEVTAAALHHYRWESQGAAQAAEESHFLVKPTRF